MKLLNDLRKLSHQITSGNDWGQDCLLHHNGMDYEIRCKYTRHHQSFNDLGSPISALNAIMEVHVYELEKHHVPFVNSHGKIELRNATVVISDTVSFRKYAIRSTIPDESLGIIVCNLELIDNKFTP